jgi:carbon monoxide dehydrogenase subunit G
MHARARSRLVAAALVGVAGALLAGAAVPRGIAAQETAEPFSLDEQRRLRAGELVTRDVARREGPFRMQGGTSWNRVHAPIDEVWAMVDDLSAYPRLIPSLDEARLIEEQGDERLIYMRHAYSLATASYYARVHLEPERYHVRFDLDVTRPHDLRAGRGFITLSPFHGDTIVAWGVLADVGGGLVTQVFGSMMQQWMLEVPRCIKNEIELGYSRC